jgi:hypothetical protein
MAYRGKCVEDFIKTVDEKFSPRRGLRKLSEIPFELQVMACFRHLHLGGPLNQQQAPYFLEYSSLQRFFLGKFLGWMEEMKDEYIHLPQTDEEINHGERLFCACVHPGTIGSIGCVHVGWHKCRYTIKVQCTNNGDGDSKGKPSLVFQVVVSHTTLMQSLSRMHWGATTDSTIYKFDAAVHELATGINATQKFTMWKDHGNKIMAIGLYYIVDGGYSKLKYITPPLNGLKLERKRTGGPTLLTQQENMLNDVV